MVLPATTIDGPSQEIVGFGGVAMAEDGTGGLVYLKRVEGVPHVFVSQYLEGHWLPPVRVDVEEPFAASWPRIGAANDGELIVVWATAYATEHEEPVDELMGAELGPAASHFGQAIQIDPNIQDATGTSPDLAVSSTGQADVVYRVVNRGISGEIPLLHPGDVVEQVRVAHFGRHALDGVWERSIASRGHRCARPPKPTPRRSRSARPATAWSSGRSRKSAAASRASGRGGCSAASSTT